MFRRAGLDGRGGRLAIGVLAALALTLGNAGIASAADPGYSWQSGPLFESQDFNCITADVEQEAGAYMSYYFDPATPPVAQGTYYVAINVTGIGNTCAGIYADIQLNLPSGTSLAIDSTHPVQCFLEFPGASSYVSDGGNCPVTLSLGTYGYSLDPTNANPGFWPLPRGGTVEVNVPIKSAAGANTITGVVQLADGDLNPILEPTVLTIVNSAAQVSNNDADAVSISYASPTITSQSAVNSSTTKVYFSGFVWNHSITTGGAYAEVAFPSAPSSTSTPTTNCSNPYLTSSYSFPYTVGPAALQSPETAITSNINVYAGTPYCFRIYATVGSTTYYGNWEFFQSIGSPPAGGPYGTHSAPSVGTTNCSTSGGGCATSSCSAGGTCGGCSTSCAGGFGNSLAPPPPAVVSPPPPPPPALSPIAPTLTGAAQARDRWRMGSALAVISKAKHHKAKGPPVGDTFTFTLNETASVSLTFLRESTGRSVGGRCATETKANKHKHKCTISTPVGTLSFTGHAGTNTVVFDGRVSATQTLTPGGYSVGLAATNTAAQASATSSLSFTIAK